LYLLFDSLYLLKIFPYKVTRKEAQGDLSYIEVVST
jgi:hypothetical protein